MAWIVARKHGVGGSLTADGLVPTPSVASNRPNRRLSIVLLVIVSGLVVGCGERRYPVSGKITFDDGSPYTGGGAVAFETGAGKDRIMVRAVIQEDGTFSTAAGSPGALAGDYRVRLIPPPQEIFEPPPDEVDNPRPRPIPPPKPTPFDEKFRRFESSGLEWKVGPGAESLQIKIGDPPTR